MRIRAHFHEEAGIEYDAAFDWYVARSPDAAPKFDVEVERARSRRSLKRQPAGQPVSTPLAGSFCTDSRSSSFIESFHGKKFKSSQFPTRAEDPASGRTGSEVFTEKQDEIERNKEKATFN